MSAMIEMQIDSVRVSLMSNQRVIILRQKAGERYLPIWVGASEADAITVALQEVEIARPLTHDLLKNLLALLGAHLLRVEIAALKGDIFYANLVLEREGVSFELDARPSDAIALAVRTHSPVLCAQEVLDEAGIVPERDLQESSLESEVAEQPGEPEPEPPAAPPDEQRLDVFDDFLKKLGSDPGEEPPAGS